jgi:hypothetical protein
MISESIYQNKHTQQFELVSEFDENYVEYKMNRLKTRLAEATKVGLETRTRLKE